MANSTTKWPNNGHSRNGALCVAVSITYSRISSSRHKAKLSSMLKDGTCKVQEVQMVICQNNYFFSPCKPALNPTVYFKEKPEPEHIQFLLFFSTQIGKFVAKIKDQKILKIISRQKWLISLRASANMARTSRLTSRGKTHIFPELNLLCTTPAMHSQLCVVYWIFTGQKSDRTHTVDIVIGHRS